MELTVEYLRQRHAYWIERLADAGIWEADKFKPVERVVRERCKSYVGLFHRKWVKVNVRRRLRDRIIIYRRSADMSVEEIDDTLVHEMIHQYILEQSVCSSLMEDLDKPEGHIFGGDRKIQIKRAGGTSHILVV